MRILFLGPDLNKQGGVKTFCQAVMKSFRQDVQYFVRGSRPGKSFIYNRSIVYFKDYLRYFKTLNSVAFDLVHINISLGYGGILRDVFFIVVGDKFRESYTAKGAGFVGQQWLFSARVGCFDGA